MLLFLFFHLCPYIFGGRFPSLFPLSILYYCQLQYRNVFLIVWLYNCRRFETFIYDGKQCNYIEYC